MALRHLRGALTRRMARLETRGLLFRLVPGLALQLLLNKELYLVLVLLF